MINWKALAFTSFGFSAGLAFAVACGQGNGGGEVGSGPSVPGVPDAFAQSASCAQWLVRDYDPGPASDTEAGDPIPPGWVPLSGDPALGGQLWIVRCAQ